MKTVLVTGGSSGIGAATAKLFLEEDYTVISLERQNTSPEGNNENSLIKNTKYHKIFLDLNMTEEINQINEKLDDINIEVIDSLINCAGIGDPTRISEMSLDNWDKVIRVNLTSPFFLIKYLIKRLLKSEYPSIVNVSSIAGRSKSLKLGCHYSTSKAAIIGMTRHLAWELGDKNIRVNCVAPSQTLTPMLEKTMSAKEQLDLADKNPLKRLAYPGEVANVIKFLCSKEASYINGAIIDVNGGFL